MSHYDVRTYSARSSVGYLMRRGASLLRDDLESAFAGAGVTFTQWVTLKFMCDDPAITPAEICRDLHHDSGAFTRVLDQLEERGLLRRERSDTDRRVVQLHLTPAGRRMVESLLPIVVDRLNAALEDFTAAEVAMLTKLLLRLTGRLEARTLRRPVSGQKGPRT